MSLDLVADAINPLLIGVLAVLIVHDGRRHGLKSLIASLFAGGVTIGLIQQAAKWAQREAWVSSEFPSTHFAVHLSVLTLLVLIRPRWWPITSLALLYGALMLWQNYHTPLEMLGSFYAIPLSSLIFLTLNRVHAWLAQSRNARSHRDVASA